ncbi:unnamed protein product [Aureobasidium mustum]|uniref:Uncharacterized protein n=1 Tax=Aureobasidium mustum TaxID=2773714 RepID=A0A9N8KAT1_9PEZI|nr:unnamed protein product [Aureobasidium mustum]
MSTQRDTLMPNAPQLWLPALRAALKKIRHRRARRAPPSTTMVDQATQTKTWLDDQHQLESQDEDHKEAEETGLRFMDLPLELRREVYRHYINDLPPLMHSSLQICREVADVTDPVCTFRMFNGRCSPFNLKFIAADAVAAKLKFLCDKSQREKVRLRIELQCPHNYVGMMNYHLEAILEVVRAKKMAPVEVYMTEDEVCSLCALDPDPDPDPVRLVRELVERVERMRDRRTGIYGVQTRCDCKGRRLE